MCLLTACIEILCGPLLISHWSLFGLGSLINFTHVLTNYILPFEKIGNTELFKAKLISWRLGEQSGRRIKSFANDRRCDLLLSLCFIISCWGVWDFEELIPGTQHGFTQGHFWKKYYHQVIPTPSSLISFKFECVFLIQSQSCRNQMVIIVAALFWGICLKDKDIVLL